jgi:3-oxoisoapionate kinase
MPDRRLLLSYYGDDFTGSTDVMEALATDGIRTVLFTGIPLEKQLESFADCDAIGLAGTSRSETPDWMDTHLRDAFEWLKSLDASHCHYKVCSTFDSSPAVGSIGKAIEIGSDVFRQKTVPLMVGAPQLKRYTAFGHLFAAYRGEVYRIDRHPVMSRHPVTPMAESDLRVHLGAQTILPVDLRSFDRLDQPLQGEGIVLLDVLDAASQVAAGRRLLEIAAQNGPFVVGSSGVEYAMLQAWEGRGGNREDRASFADVPAADRVVAVSGSVSPTTERQIRYALSHGFRGLAVDALALSRGDTDLTAIIEAALAMLSGGASVLIYTALGGTTERSADLDSTPGSRHRLGRSLGKIARALIERAGVRRLIVAGGDTSSHAIHELGIHALMTRMPLPATPGSPLCLAHSDNSHLDGLELALKGGQIGGDDYFALIRDGLRQDHDLRA